MCETLRSWTTRPGPQSPHGTKRCRSAQSRFTCKIVTNAQIQHIISYVHISVNTVRDGQVASSMQCKRQKHQNTQKQRKSVAVLLYSSGIVVVPYLESPDKARRWGLERPLVRPLSSLRDVCPAVHPPHLAHDIINTIVSKQPGDITHSVLRSYYIHM